MSNASPPLPKSKRPRWKRYLFRLVAVVLGLLPLVVLELVLRVLGVGKPTEYNDPFVGFSDVHPLFVLNDDRGQYEIAPSRHVFFAPDAFPATKAPDAYRIFVLGGSTVQGRPWSIQTSFTTWLRLSLQVADPDRRWEVINCGGLSYASYRLTLIMREVLRYQPDLIILCTGHNEFLEERSYEHVKHAPVVLTWSQRRFSRLRTYNVFRSGLLAVIGHSADPNAQDRPVFGPELPNKLADEVGWESYQRDDEWQRRVMQHFDVSVRGMISLAQDADVPMLLIAPVSNLEWEPFKSEPSSALDAAQRERLLELYDDALAAKDAGAYEQVLVLYHQALKMDKRFAHFHWIAGTAYQQLGAYAQAKAAYVRAKDEDVCPLRMLEAMRGQMHKIADDTGTPLIDAHQFFEQRSIGGIPGTREWLVDHVHPSIEGYQRWADRIANRLAERGIVKPPVDWKRLSQLEYDRWYDSLKTNDKKYFIEGSMNVRAVQNWGRRPRGKP